MKQVKVFIPAEKVTIIQEVEEHLDLSFEVSIYQDNATILTIIENDQTSALLEELKGLGVGTVFGSIIVSPVDLEITSEQKKAGEKGRGISLDEMISNIRGLAVVSPTFVILSILAGLLSSFGLINDHVVIIIASMIIAPFLGPIALSVISTMIPKNPFFKQSVFAEVTGLGICILIGYAVGWFNNYFLTQLDPILLPTEILIRTQPGVGDIVFAIMSGLAAGILIIRGENASLVGVAVAASLCPPAANVGVLLASSLWTEATGSFVLLSLNVIAIYSACAIIFWTSQSLARGGTISSRQYKKMSRKYRIQSSFAIMILIIMILFILL